ncbi:lasso RiPP family leader peptide-containing protein [Thermoactinomyces sp. DSM 45892]|nr:lasso RiPP family leader peptide-containing protein [Thermoactinomyces sp. DSM 45892]SDY25424.1 hypothetical protein SAMN05444416_103102 [Thermoactinomyces sp. DSM 45892]
MKKQEKKVYQAPKVVKIGSFEKLTLGSEQLDTADMKKYYS